MNSIFFFFFCLQHTSLTFFFVPIHPPFKSQIKCHVLGEASFWCSNLKRSFCYNLSISFSFIVLIRTRTFILFVWLFSVCLPHSSLSSVRTMCVLFFIITLTLSTVLGTELTHAYLILLNGYKNLNNTWKAMKLLHPAPLAHLPPLFRSMRAVWWRGMLSQQNLCLPRTSFWSWGRKVLFYTNMGLFFPPFY